MPARLNALNATRGVVLADHARIADNLWTRLVGLLRDKHLDEGDGLWIKPCNSIHSFWMKFLFDAVFLDQEHRVVHLMAEMKPWRASPMTYMVGGRQYVVLAGEGGILSFALTE